MNGATGSQERVYYDFEVWIGPLSKPARYPVQVISSPDGYGEGCLELDIADNDFMGDLERVRGIEKNQDLREKFGQRLFDALFVRQVRDRWKGSLSRLKGIPGQPGLRLRLAIVDPDLALLPWELLYDKEPGFGFLGATANQTVSRYLPMAEPVDFAMPKRVRVLVVIASPPEGLSETLKPVPQQEIDGLIATLEGLKDKGVDYQALHNRSSSDIFDALQEEYHVFHYVGHGGSGELYLIDENDKIESLDAQSFAQSFLGRPCLRLVVLNACSSAQADSELAGCRSLFSGVGPSLVQRGVPAVVAMQYHSVYSDTAQEFSKRFYASLAKGLPVDVAVNEARRALSVKHLAERDWSTPVLYMGTRTGRILTFPGASAQGGSVSKTAAADLWRRSNRMKEWVRVKSAVFSARSNVDGLFKKIREARSPDEESPRRPGELLRMAGRIQTEWDDVCAQGTKALDDELAKVHYVSSALMGDGASPSQGSVAGWRQDFAKRRDALKAVLSRALPDEGTDTLKSILVQWEDQCRPLLDWLHARDTDCSAWLNDEANALAELADSLWGAGTGSWGDGD